MSRSLKLTGKESKDIQDFIEKQIKEEGIKNLDELKPIDHGTVAKPHTPVYKMHRYFARRPWSVFNELIKHYSNPGSIILDPFCGGGVTVIEGLRLRRKVIGVDLNPMATFITRMEAIDVDLEELEKTFEEIKKAVKNQIEELYLTKCPNCGKETPAEWFEWSYIYQCPRCKNPNQLNKAKKIKGGKYECIHCKNHFKIVDAKRVGEVPIRLKVNCSCGYKKEKEPDRYDLNKVRTIEKNFEKIVKEKKLWYPKDKIFLGEKTRELLTKNFKYFYELFTKRNLLALAILLGEIRKIKSKNIREIFYFIFSSTLRGTNQMCFLPARWQGGSPCDWAGHHYWLPNTPLEWKVWDYFLRCYKKIIKGKQYSQKEINGFYKEAKSFEDLKNNKTCLILTQSSTKLPIPDESVDVVITDPPYGGNVNYTELSDFWSIWLKDVLDGLNNGIIDNTEEAIINKYQRKGIREYRDLMYKVFKECYRVLKPGRWLVMTFHNRDFKVWNAINLAAHDAGFILSEEDGMIYQPPIQQYTTTLHQRASGSMLGDFVLSFKKAEKIPKFKMIEDMEIGYKVRKIAAETIQYHGAAKLSTIYMRLIPFLLNNGLLHQVKENDIVKFLKKEFEERNGKWYFKEDVDEVEGVKPLDYVPVEARIEFLIRSLLYRKKKAKMDEILGAVFTNLINSNAAEYEEITRVLNRIAEKADERNWQLKEMGSLAQRKVLEWIEGKRIKEEEIGSREEKTEEESLHDLMIEQIVELGEREGYDSHIGQTEQRKYVKFRKMSIPMGNASQFGLSNIAFDRIKEIDVLWIKGNTIIAAFEIEKSTTIDSGIARFRELFAATPNLNIQAYIVIPDKREKEAIKKIGSLANRKEGLHKKIKYLLFSDIKNKKDIKIEDKAKEVI